MSEENIVKLLELGYHFRNEIKNYINYNYVDKKDFCNTETYYSFTIINGKRRKLSFPNIYHYNSIIEKITQDSDLTKKLLKYQNDNKNIMNLNLEKMDFIAGDGREFLNSMKYDKIIKGKYIYKIDMANYYDQIYTHNIENIDEELKKLDKYIRSINSNKTNGIIMVTILSVIIANIIMGKLCDKVIDRLKQKKYENIEIKYFSDQMYIYSNKQIENVYDLVATSISDSKFFYKINHTDSFEYTTKKIITELREFYDVDILLTDEDVHKSLKKITYYIVEKDLYKETYIKYIINKIFNRKITLINLYKKIEENPASMHSIVENLLFIFFRQPSIIMKYEEKGITNLLKITF